MSATAVSEETRQEAEPEARTFQPAVGNWETHDGNLELSTNASSQTRHGQRPTGILGQRIIKNPFSVHQERPNTEIRDIQYSSFLIQRRDMNKLITFQQAFRPKLRAYLQSMSQDPQSRPRSPTTRNVQLRSIFVGQVSNLPQERGDY